MVHRGKAAQAAWAKKKGDKMRNATGPSMESMRREAEADAEMIRDTVAEAKRRGVLVAQVIRERRGS